MTRGEHRLSAGNQAGIRQGLLRTVLCDDNGRPDLVEETAVTGCRPERLESGQCFRDDLLNVRVTAFFQHVNIPNGPLKKYGPSSCQQEEQCKLPLYNSYFPFPMTAQFEVGMVGSLWWGRFFGSVATGV